MRWVRLDGREVRHRYFRRRHDAVLFAARVRAAGRRVAVFVSDTEWAEVSS